MNVPQPTKKCTKSSLFRRFFSAAMNIQFLKIKLHFKYFCKFFQGEYQRGKYSTEDTKLTGTHSEKEGGFQLAANLGDWHRKKDLSLIKNEVLDFNILIKFMSCSKLLEVIKRS